ncbi:MAG: hypothetical protein ACK5MP_06505 [Nostocoides sp.]
MRPIRDPGSPWGPLRPVSPSKTPPLLTLTGVLLEGVESGATVLQTASGERFELIGPMVARLRADALTDVTVRGRTVPDIATTTQQGTALLLTQILLPE